MKRIIAAVAAVTMLCSFMTACTKDTENDVQSSEVSSQEVSSAASETVSVKSEPVKTEPESKLVEINMDNWTDYFEEELVETIDVDSDERGVITTAIARYNLKVRDEYVSKLDLNNTEAEIRSQVIGIRETSFIYNQDGAAVVGDVYEEQGEEISESTVAEFVPKTDDTQLLELTFVNEQGYIYGENGAITDSFFAHYADPQIFDIEGTIALF